MIDVDTYYLSDFDSDTISTYESDDNDTDEGTCGRHIVEIKEIRYLGEQLKMDVWYVEKCCNCHRFSSGILIYLFKICIYFKTKNKKIFLHCFYIFNIVWIDT